jgi:hypothetical protein
MGLTLCGERSAMQYKKFCFRSFGDALTQMKAGYLKGPVIGGNLAVIDRSAPLAVA